MNKFARLGTIALAGLVLGACTFVPASNAPRAINHSQVPFGLLGKTIPGTRGARVKFQTQPVYIVDATGHLAPSSRIVPVPATLASTLRQLLIGPSLIEQSAGYSSAIPKEVVLLSASISHGVGHIDLSRSLNSLKPTNQLLAAGQLLLTARDVGATGGVEISVGGVAQLILTPKGSRVRLAKASDFASLLGA
jgi:Sporulation and spore germination